MAQVSVVGALSTILINYKVLAVLSTISRRYKVLQPLESHLQVEPIVINDGIVPRAQVWSTTQKLKLNT